ncbi:helix-turn-helix domain-containing protein [Rossellomorea arthrocnemi]|uniref:Helix-turn-helix domain-containing protein n=1 Tax=Rossellomorea vietnamensis TaxID=218284 RepID=A0A6I6UVZ3_9BACI|nr:helix-turn-helix transcriptional regulator [Rossellomorea vietnamensis]QHE63941.1 helix-turn-helix domain-containing protein [Rossellomorea vietnamensis]
MTQIYFTLDKVLNNLGITPNYLSSVSGVRTATLYKIQHNTLQRPNLDTLEKVLDALNKIAAEKKLKKIHIHDLINSK